MTPATTLLRASDAYLDWAHSSAAEEHQPMAAEIMGLSVFGRGPCAHRLVDKTGRNMAFWIGHMEAWAEKQRHIVARRARGALPLPR